MKKLQIGAGIVLLISLCLFSTNSFAGSRHVNCDRGQSLQKAVEKVRSTNGISKIFVKGECEETITIRRDHLYIYGNPFAVIKGQVRVFSSNNVRLYDLEITGPGFGLVVSGGSDVATSGVYLRGNEGVGLLVRRDSNVWFRDSHIIGNCEYLEDENCEEGAHVEDASLSLEGSSVTYASIGIVADISSVVVLRASGDESMTEIAFNSAVGVQAALHSVVEIADNTSLHDNRYHAVYALQDSAVRIQDPEVAVTGNIGCGDVESSFANIGGGSITSTDCSDFN